MPWAWDCISPKAKGRSSNGRCARGESGIGARPAERYVIDAVEESGALDGSVPLISFAGGPYTLACYWSGSQRRFTIKTMLYARPDLLHRILEVNAQAVTHCLNAQIEAGAQAVMIFDTWGGNLSHAAYREFSLAYLQRIIAGLKREQAGARVPAIVFTKGCGNWLEDIAAIGCDAVGLDWSVDIGQARARIGDRVALQGNIDPAVLFSPAKMVRRETEKILASFGHGSGHVSISATAFPNSHRRKRSKSGRLRAPIEPALSRQQRGHPRQLRGSAGSTNFDLCTT